MLSKPASAASARSGFVRAMRPRITRHSSSATPLTASITTAEGASRNSRNKAGRASPRPIPASAHAASLATARSASSSSSSNKGMAAGEAHAQRQAPVRISGTSCRSKGTIVLPGRAMPSWAAASRALTQPRSLHNPFNDNSPHDARRLGSADPNKRPQRGDLLRNRMFSAKALETPTKCLQRGYRADQSSSPGLRRKAAAIAERGRRDSGNEPVIVEL